MEKAKIFVADDDAAFLELMQELLQDEGYEVTILHDSDNAYDEIKPAAPDLVILDMTLEHPGAGWHVLEMLKLDPETAKMPVIVCSADLRLLGERQAQLEQMGYYVVEKPFDIDMLLSAVHQALASARQPITQS
jgi:CheY-like chemotaxis protein